jgi:hypothetical protein
MGLGRNRSGPPAQAAFGRRRVRAVVAIPIIALCGSLGAVAGVLFPVYQEPVAHEAGTLQRSAEAPQHALLPDALPARVALGAAKPEAGAPSSRDYPASLPHETSSGAIATLSGAVAARERVVPDAAEAAASRAEKRQEATRHEAFSRHARARRARYAALRRRASNAAGAPASNGSLLQIPLVGPVAGMLLQ